MGLSMRKARHRHDHAVRRKALALKIRRDLLRSPGRIELGSVSWPASGGQCDDDLDSVGYMLLPWFTPLKLNVSPVLHAACT